MSIARTGDWRRGFIGACAVAMAATSLGGARAVAAEPDSTTQWLVVDCLLPGQVRTLGQRSVYMTARRPARLPARECQIRGGEFVSYDRADLASALAAWLPAAERGDKSAQVIVGEIYERGMGVGPDYAAAMGWYRRAADQGDARAEVNIGQLFERGLGVAPDAATALEWYRRAAGKGIGVAIDRLQTAAAESSMTTALEALQSKAAALQHNYDEQRRVADELQSQLEIARREGAAQAQRVTELEAGTTDSDAALANEKARFVQLTAQLTAREQELTVQRDRASGLDSELQRVRAELESLRLPIRQGLLAGPEVTLIEPLLSKTRDIVPVAATATGTHIVGRVTAPAGLTMLSVNDQVVNTNEFGVFRMDLKASDAEIPVLITAIDAQGKRSDLHFAFRGASVHPAVDNRPSRTRLPGELPRSAFGRFHALIIGNNNYRFLPKLSSPIDDAKDLADVLQRRYGFATTVLIDADRYQVLSALNNLRESLTSEDNLLIYFAGHGELDEVNQRGHWLPVDAERNSTANWIPTTAVTDLINIMRAKQVMLVVDSCYAGALTRSAMAHLDTGMSDIERMHWLRTMAQKRSRTVLTSGGVAPVLDAGGGRHSVFAKALLQVLDANDGILEGQRLHREVAARVAYAAANMRFDQVPEYAPIRFAGHEAGEFFLVADGREKAR
ncbi:MAG: caspase family protein [Steroidobacteraceae bacterium]